MKFTKILVPYDGSEHARDALTTAEDLLDGAPEAKIVVLNVIAASDVNPTYGRDNPFWSSADLMGLDEYKHYMVNAIESARKSLSEAVKDDLAKYPDQVSVDVVTYPSTAEGISDYAKQNGVDLIVMGRRGLGALRGMLGSVSFSVLRDVDIPVLTVK